MARSFVINGPTLVQVKGPVGSAIASLSELGVCDRPITCQLDISKLDIDVDAFGQIPPDSQVMGGMMTVSTTFVHYDKTILDECLRLGMGGPTTVGTLPQTGTLMGNGAARFAANNYFIGLNLTSPVEGKPYRFLYAEVHGNPFSLPLGAERSLTTVTWRCRAYTADPYNGGQGFGTTTIWDNTLDS